MRAMTLGKKIILLFAFMGITILCIFLWFISQMLHHVNGFNSSMAKDTQALEEARDQSLKKLKEKAGQMGEEVNDHFNKMEKELLKSRKEAEIFHENFIQRQNQAFEEIDNFVGAP